MKSESEPAQEGGADHRPGWLNTGLRCVRQLNSSSRPLRLEVHSNAGGSLLTLFYSPSLSSSPILVCAFFSFVILYFEGFL